MTVCMSMTWTKMPERPKGSDLFQCNYIIVLFCSITVKLNFQVSTLAKKKKFKFRHENCHILKLKINVYTYPINYLPNFSFENSTQLVLVLENYTISK